MGPRGVTQLIFSVLFFVSISAHVNAGAPTSKAEFCERRLDSHYFRQLSYEKENLLTFRNGGGLFNKGVCWWHNLFQRSALYLVVFRPELPKPNKALARKIIHAIAAGRRVVEVPGYKNLSEFSKDWAAEIQSKLEAWQREDGFLKFAWIQGLSGNYHADPKVIAAALNYSILQAEQSGQINFAMWQLKGISAHASLMIGGEIENTTYRAHHIDSNFPNVIRAMNWQPPARSVDSYFGKFVPYVGRKSDLPAFKTAGDQYCASRSYDHDFIYERLSNHID